LPSHTARKPSLDDVTHGPIKAAPCVITADRQGDRSTEAAEPPIHCDNCDAVCCRLTVVLLPGDDVPEHLTTITEAGLHVMARDDEGWCVGIDHSRMCCSIYANRPAICRKFRMGGPYCREVRADYADRRARGIALTLY
jgi:Fe-S-cluster containining protein